MIPGRLEAIISVPTAGAAFSAQNAAMSVPVALTLPSADYFLSALGGLPGLCSTMQSLLNDNVQGYPQTAAAMAAAVGYGTWSSGWLLNITSGNDAGVFGGVTLTAASTPVYSIAGPRGGIDLAVGVDSAADQFTGGNNFNVTATDDLCIAWIGKWTGAATAPEMMFVKGNSGAARWTIWRDNASGNLILDLVSASGTKSTNISTTALLNVWHVGIAVIDRGGGAGRIAVCPLGGAPTVSATTTLFAETMSNADNFTVLNRNAALPATKFQLAGLYAGAGAGVAVNMSANLSTAVQSFANAINAAWTVSLSTTDGRFSIGWSGYATPTWSLTFTDSNLRDLSGFTANIAAVTTTQTGTKQARGLWFPDCQLFIRDSDPRLAPIGNDGRSTVAPTGADPITLIGTYFREHKSLLYSLIPLERIREQSATYANASWRQFWDDTQLGKGLSWFKPGSNVLIIDHTGQAVGSDMQTAGPTRGWHIADSTQIQPKRADADGWPGFWSLELPQLIAEDA